MLLINMQEIDLQSFEAYDDDKRHKERMMRSCKALPVMTTIVVVIVRLLTVRLFMQS